ncbi:DUF6702 family protein [Algibacter sp. R77976]|uniref:DUF6702 family protein n=1 Tax=Algibacter sp. R77976 TaxID=3093873 RepID=UPI0037C8E905
MKGIKFLIIAIVIPLFAFTSLHKYYISVTHVNYVEEKESIQLISRIFIDDFESALKSNYDETIVLAEENEAGIINTYMDRYLQENIKLKVNNKDVIFNFIGKEYEGDIVKCYLEVQNVKNIKTFYISNSVLFDLQKDQQNIIKTKIYSKNKSVILTSNNLNALLKFD